VAKRETSAALLKKKKNIYPAKEESALRKIGRLLGQTRFRGEEGFLQKKCFREREERAPLQGSGSGKIDGSLLSLAGGGEDRTYEGRGQRTLDEKGQVNILFQIWGKPVLSKGGRGSLSLVRGFFSLRREPDTDDLPGSVRRKGKMKDGRPEKVLQGDGIARRTLSPGKRRAKIARGRSREGKEKKGLPTGQSCKKSSGRGAPSVTMMKNSGKKPPSPRGGDVRRPRRGTYKRKRGVRPRSPRGRPVGLYRG